MTESNGTLFRAIGLDVEIRSSGDGRTLSGILVPYSAPTRIDSSLVEEFVPGAFGAQVRAMTPGRLNDGGMPRIPLCREHLPHGGQVIGRVTSLREDAAGLYGEARISNTQLGNDTLALMNDDVLRDWSIGFRPGQNRAAGAVTQRVQAHLTELAIVPQGAYGSLASVGSIRASAYCANCGGEMTPAAADVMAQIETGNLPETSDLNEPVSPLVANSKTASQLIATLPMLGLKGPKGAPGGPATFAP